ncbi:MAG: CoA-acylating methylmalonate-semialdehyde dehydrogenase [Actinomycetota bacterium]|nr:CoA-acylating methylmalonate-semialdehyde dehydrogenase [Actinomycetota bacterium]
MSTLGHFIDGKLQVFEDDRLGDVFDPALGSVSSQVALASKRSVDHVVEVALRAFEEWSNSSLSQRTKVLFAFRELVNRRADDIAALITSEHGKVLSDARGEVQRGLEVVEFACGIPQLLKGDFSSQVSTAVDVYSFREPLGVCVGITPFNFPAMVPMWMFPVAIACGNTFILKPSEKDPSASLLIAELWREAGLPDGVFNVINGDQEAVNALLDHPDVAAVSFVGSTPIAKYIYERASQSGKRVQALGGAKNHAIVLEDADLDFVTENLTAAAFGSAGERCMAISAAIAVGDRANDIGKLVAERASKIKVGSGTLSDVEMGPVITNQSKVRIEGLITKGVDQGASALIDGRNYKVDGYESGFFVGPTVIDDVTVEMDVYREEIFGPVLSVLHVNDVEDAIAMINANPYGNGTAIFTGSGDAARRFSRGVKVGMIGINVPIPVPMAYYSFGGWKNSLFGQSHIHGPEGVAFYTRAKVVTQRWFASHIGERASLSFPTAK